MFEIHLIEYKYVTVTNTITEQTTANLPTITTEVVEETTTTTAGTEFHEWNIEIICIDSFWINGGIIGCSVSYIFNIFFVQYLQLTSGFWLKEEWFAQRL